MVRKLRIKTLQDNCGKPRRPPKRKGAVIRKVQKPPGHSNSDEHAFVSIPQPPWEQEQ